jgi:hypothetical protein
MNQLLHNPKPTSNLSKVVLKKLTPNATKLLYPLQSQKLLLRRPGKEGQFGKLKVSLRIEELLIPTKLISEAANTSAKPSNLASSGTAIPIAMNTEINKNENKVAEEMV